MGQEGPPSQGRSLPPRFPDRWASSAGGDSWDSQVWPLVLLEVLQQRAQVRAGSPEQVSPFPTVDVKKLLALC